MAELDDSAQALAQVATTVRSGDRDAVVAQVLGQGASLLSGLPGVGALVEATLASLVGKNSAWRKMKDAVADLEAEAADAARARRIFGVIGPLLREAVEDAPGVDHAAALAALDERLDALQAAIERVGQSSTGVVNHVGHVEKGSVGVNVGTLTLNNTWKG